jgi:membrane protein
VIARLQRLKDVVLRLYRSVDDDRVLALAAGATFYAILALSPALASGVSLYSLFADARTIAGHLTAFEGFMPTGALEVMRDQLTRLAARPAGTIGVTFLVSLALSLWSANAGTKSVLDALNIVYGHREERGFFKLNVVSLAFTAGALLFALLAIAATVVLPVMLDVLGLKGITDTLLRLARWPLLYLAVCLALAMLYYQGPCREQPKWRWVSAGSIVAATLWLVVSILFSWYAANFGKYNETYGSLGAIVAFMVWVWLSVVVILLGGEVDEHLEEEVDGKNGNQEAQRSGLSQKKAASSRSAKKSPAM